MQYLKARLEKREEIITRKRVATAMMNQQGIFLEARVSRSALSKAQMSLATSAIAGMRTLHHSWHRPSGSSNMVSSA